MKITAIHFRKLSAVTEMKMVLFKKQKTLSSCRSFPSDFTFLMKILYRSIADSNMDGYALSLRRSDEYFHERVLTFLRKKKKKKYASDTDDFFKRT